MAGSWLVILDFCVLAVWHLGKEDACVALWVESLLFLGHFFIRLIIGSRTWIISRWELFILNIDCGLEDLANVFWSLEVTNGCTILAYMHVWVVKGRANSVLSSSRVHVHIDFLWGDWSWLRTQLVNLILMSLRKVLVSGLVQVRGVAHELEISHVVARVWVGQVSGWLVDTWTGGSWTETRDLLD